MADIVLVTLVHNRKEYLGRALISAWNQTLDKSKWIHLLIDNASTDGAGEIAERFYETHKDSNIRFVRLPTNLGIQNGHNYVLKEYIPNNCPEAKIFSLLESDDILPMEALLEVHKMFTEHPEIGETYSDFSIIDKDERLLFRAHPKAVLVPNLFTAEGQKKLRRIFNHNPIGHQRSYSIVALRDIGGFDSNYEWANDIDVAARMLTKYPVVKINKVLYIWRQHDDSASAHNSPKQTEQFWELVNTYTKKWKETGLL
jgi:glycosyltransferase involved in cell wall biosynthesis